MKVLRIDRVYIRRGYPYFNRAVRFARALPENVQVVDAEYWKGGRENNKYSDLRTLRDAGVVKYPFALVKNRKDVEEFMAKNNFSFPIVLKWQYGMGAKYVYIAQDINEALDAIYKHPIDEVLVMEYVKADVEYKCIVLQGKVEFPVLCTPHKSDGFGSDLLKPYTMNIKDIPGLEEAVVKACDVLGKSISKVDVLSRGGELFILEVNRSPGFEYYETGTQLNVLGRVLEILTK